MKRIVLVIRVLQMSVKVIVVSSDMLDEERCHLKQLARQLSPSSVPGEELKVD
jgi:hypothetical protein